MRLKHLPLSFLAMPGSTYPHSIMKQLHTLFPSADIEVYKKVNSIDSDIHTLCAPLH
jgi:hypothetical protein